MNETLKKSAASVKTADDFRRWVKTQLRPIMPHGVALCGLGHLHAGGVGLDYIISVDFPIEHIQQIRNRAGAIDTPVLRRWLIQREPLFFDGKKPWDDIPETWLASFRTCDLRNVVAHAMFDYERCIGTYHSFYRLDKEPDQAYINSLREVTPLMHEMMCTVIGSVNASDRFASYLATLNEKEREVVRWAGMGKTNPEIAMIMGMSESTIKHYLTVIFDKLVVSNRAQLVRNLADHEAKAQPGQTTKLL